MIWNSTTNKPLNINIFGVSKIHKGIGCVCEICDICVCFQSFLDGKVVDPDVTDESVERRRQLNAFLSKDERIDISFLAVGDGTTICRIVWTISCSWTTNSIGLKIEN